MYYCSLDHKAFETKEGLQYLYAAGPDEDDPDVVRYHDWVVCADGCADKVRADSTKVVVDRPWSEKGKND